MHFLLLCPAHTLRVMTGVRKFDRSDAMQRMVPQLSGIISAATDTTALDSGQAATNFKAIPLLQ